MAQNVQVLVKSKDSNSESTITYRAYLELQGSVDLVGQVDDDGNLIPGDPNLQPRHRKGASENAIVSNPIIPLAPAADAAPQQHGTTSIQEFHMEHAEQSGIAESNQQETDEPEVELEIQSAPGEPVKERKKPGPKPKNKEV